jgi:transcriptional antiterminator NusG
VGHGTDPIPLTDEEVRKMGIERIVIKIDAEPGDMVRVISGPFESFIGTIEEINDERQTVKARISMFGRETPVELEFTQIEKLT